jgi:transposase
MSIAAHEISDELWERLEPCLPGRRGQRGGVANDNRRFVSAVFLILSTGAPWRELPARYGKWGTVHQRFRRWRDNGTWETLLEAVIDQPGFEWLFIGTVNGDEEPKYRWPWLRLLCRSEQLLQRIPRTIDS